MNTKIIAKPPKLGDQRFYEIEGKSVPRVSNALDLLSTRFLYRWYSNNGTKKALEVLKLLSAEEAERAIQPLPQDFLKNAYDKSEEALTIGTDVHHLIESDLKGKRIPRQSDTSTQTAFSNYKTWKRSHKIEVIQTEMTVYSAKHDYAGTLDAILRVDGKVGIYDWKTGKRFSPVNNLQIVAYRKALKEMNPTFKVHEIGVVYFDKVKKFKASRDVHMVPYKEHRKLFTTFKHLMHGWRWAYEHGAI